ncbi:hypothetical protein ABH922_002440 [Rhodococcus sp. 27YEA15]|uniref:sensor domain-containing protein n=1 Tax=Rhodococcus sp. 27YEA15 TaxID=3156259 RepID=UPI003C7A8BE8
MRRGQFLVPAVCGALTVLAMSGCSSNDAQSQDAGSASSAVVPPTVAMPTFTPLAPAAPLRGTPPDGAALADSALTTTDLPAGFTVNPDPVADLDLAPAPADADTDKSTTDPAACSAVLEPISAQIGRTAAAHSVMFTGPGFTSIDQDLASFTDGPATEAAFDRLQSTLAGCGSYSGTDADGTSVRYTLGAGTVPMVGDTSFSFRIITESAGFTLVTDVVTVAVGASLTQVSATGPTPIAADTLGALARTAADRLAAHS